MAHIHQANENFELLGSEPLGRGGFGATWRARVVDPALAEHWGVSEVALKIPLDRRTELVLREELNLNAAVFAKLRGIIAPNVVRYLGPDKFNGLLVMVMEFVDGGSLRHFLHSRRHVRLPVDEAVGIVKGILAGVSVIHREQVLHRDIKPENILMGNGIPKIADFGLSRIVDSTAANVTQAGTHEYWSPELVNAEAVSLNSDIWSIGVTFYEMLVGERPFRSNSPRRLLDLISDGTFTPASRLRDDIPPFVNEVINTALRKNPADRFRTVEEMLNALTTERRHDNDEVAEQLGGIRTQFVADNTWREAAHSLNELANRHKGDPRVFHALGSLYGRVERLDEALVAYEKAVACDFRDPLSHYYLGLAYQRARQSDKAIASIKRAIELGLKSRFNSAAQLALRALERNSGT